MTDRPPRCELCRARIEPEAFAVEARKDRVITSRAWPDERGAFHFHDSCYGRGILGFRERRRGLMWTLEGAE